MSIVSFSDLKRGNNSLEKLNEEVSKFKSGGFTRDERYWEPEIDKSGEGGATIRFLPAPAGESIPFVRRFSYGFKGPTGKWFIENSPTTIGKACPVAELNSEHWESGSEERKEIARRQKRRLHYIANIYVVRHKARPSDEGKVFLYSFGQKIFDKLKDKMSPDEDDRRPMNPFDLWTGANFRLKIANVAGFRNYDKSEFDVVEPLSSDDAELERIWRQCHSLQGEVAEDKFKSYEELKKKLNFVLGNETTARRAVAEESEGYVTNRPADDDKTPPWDDNGQDSMDWLKSMVDGN